MILCSTGALLGRPNGRDFRLLENITPRLRCKPRERDFFGIFSKTFPSSS